MHFSLEYARSPLLKFDNSWLVIVCDLSIEIGERFDGLRNIERKYCNNSKIPISYYRSHRVMMLMIILLSHCFPAFATNSFCDIIAATNIQSVYSQWSCTTTGATSTAPCTTPWTGLICSGSNPISINFGGLGITG